jgi:hypothetical protein
MSRRISVGVVPGGIGQISVSAATISTQDTNQDLTLSPNGTGRVVITKDTQLNAQSDLRFADADSSNFVAIQAPATVPTNYTLTLPSAVSASNGFALVSDTSGVLSWAAAGAALTDNTSDSGTNYIVFTTSTTGNLTATRVSSTRMTFQPSTGTLTVTNLVESSSVALKENISPIEDALENILKLVGVTYDRRDGSRKGEAGLIAEDVVDVLPNLVTKNPQGVIDGIQYTKLTAYLIEAVKSLKKEIDSLKGMN